MFLDQLLDLLLMLPNYLVILLHPLSVLLLSLALLSIVSLHNLLGLFLVLHLQSDFLTGQILCHLLDLELQVRLQDAVFGLLLLALFTATHRCSLMENIIIPISSIINFNEEKLSIVETKLTEMSKIAAFKSAFFFILVSVLEMIRLLELTQTGRQWKIQSTFSSKKYPIYYNWDIETQETYITKIVNSKDPMVIACFKAHITQNILPYLLMRKQHKWASILDLPPEEAQVIIKINEELKKEKCAIIQNKIEEYSAMLRAYNKYFQNSIIREQLQVIARFTRIFQAKDSTLEQILKQAENESKQFLFVLDEIDKIIITKTEIKQKVSNIQSNKKQLAQDDRINSLVATLQALSKKQEIVKQEYLKGNQASQIKKQLKAFSQIVQERKTILKDFEYYQSNQYSDKIQRIYSDLLVQEDLLQMQEMAIYESNVLYITKKHIKGMNLREMITSKDERLTPQFCFDLTKTIVDLIFLHGGVKDLFITTENIIFEECGAFHLNYFSFVGLQFLKLQKYVSNADFLEILPYVTLDFLQGSNKGEIKMGIQVLLRFIIVNFVSALLKKDIIYDAKAIFLQFEVQIRDESLMKEVKKVEDKLLPKVITTDEKKILKQFDTRFKVNYCELVDVVFGKVKGKVDWQFIFSKLSKSEQGSSKLYNNNEQEKPTQKISVLQIVKNIQRSMNIGKNVFYVIGISVMEVFDHFTNILNELSFQQLKSKNKEKMIKLKRKLAYERQFYEKRGWYQKQLYIPVKCSMTFTQILDYSNWVEMIYAENRANLQTLKGVQNLLSLLLEMEEGLMIIEPLLNDDILQQALAKEKCLYYSQFYSDGVFKTYYTLLHNYKDKKSKKRAKKYTKDSFQKETDVNVIPDDETGDNVLLDSQKQSEDNDKEDYSFKKKFWQCYFATFRIVYELIRNYYIRINEVSIDVSLTINGGPFAKWMQNFNPQTPPLPVRP